MEPYTQVKLIKFIPKNGGTPQVYLHAVATFPTAWFGSQAGATLAVDGNGKWTFTLPVKQPTDQPPLHASTPVVHTLPVDPASQFNPDVDTLTIEWVDQFGIVLAQERIGGGSTAIQIESDDSTRPFPGTETLGTFSK